MSNKDYVQGVYEPLYPKKYKGTYPIIYRSSLEKKAFYRLDTQPDILEWSSESVVIPYISPVDGKVHRYFVDLAFKFKSTNGVVVKYLVEIKPYKFTKRPEKTLRKRQRTFLAESYQYAVNMSKWEAAKQWADKHGYKFIILTEKDMGLG